MSDTTGQAVEGNIPGAGADNDAMNAGDAVASAFRELSGAQSDTNTRDAQDAADEQAAAVADQNTDAENDAATPEEGTTGSDQWTDADEAALAALSPEAKALFDKRVKSMKTESAPNETQKADADLAKGIRSLVDDGGFRDVLQQSGMNEVQGVQYLMNMERFARENPAQYLHFVAGHVQERFGIDPMQVLGGNASPQGMQDQAPNDPRYQQIQQRMDQFERQSAQAAQRQAYEQVNASIASVRDAKDSAGNLIRPHWKDVEKEMTALVRANPQMPLEEAYDAAVWSNPKVRAKLQTEQRNAENKAANTKSAQAAARANVRPGQRSMVANPKIENPGDAVRAALAEITG